MRYALPLLVGIVLVTSGCFHAAEGPIIVVTASYPGADAQVVAELVAAPIEQQVNGVESMVRMESESRNDGTYIARVRFKPNTDPNLVAMLVQNRVALATPQLPDSVRRAGVAVKVGTAEGGPKNVAIALEDRGGEGHDALRRFSDALVKRLSAAGAIVKPSVFPGPDEKRLNVKRLNVQIDRDKCAQLGVPADEVMKAVQTAGAGRKIDALRALTVRSAKGDAVPLSALAAIKMASAPAGVYRVDMYPAVRITGSPPPGETTGSAAERCAELADAERKNQNHPAGFAVVDLTGQ